MVFVRCGPTKPPQHQNGIDIGTHSKLATHTHRVSLTHTHLQHTRTNYSTDTYFHHLPSANDSHKHLKPLLLGQTWHGHLLNLHVAIQLTYHMHKTCPSNELTGMINASCCDQRNNKANSHSPVGEVQRSKIRIFRKARPAEHFQCRLKVLSGFVRLGCDAHGVRKAQALLQCKLSLCNLQIFNNSHSNLTDPLSLSLPLLVSSTSLFVMSFALPNSSTASLCRSQSAAHLWGP